MGLIAPWGKVCYDVRVVREDRDSAMVKSKIKFTYKDYKNLPESETKRYELLEGELVMVPSPTTYHQRISWNLERILGDFVAKHDLGVIHHAPLDVVFSQEDVAQPDIFFISKAHSQIITDANIQGAPDLIIEILSSATGDRDRTYKRTLYARHGVREYWIVDPADKSVEVMTLGEKGFGTVQLYKMGQTLVSPLLKGFSLNLKEIF
jgi:Uma2 family endonuclease